MSIPLANAGVHKINQTQFVAESRIFCKVRYHAIGNITGNNYQKITMTTVKNNKLAGAVEDRGRTFTSC
jgi:hypothetical protein